MLIESLRIMLQISILLACGLSRYMWSVNVSVARAVASFTILGALFYIGIVVVRTSSYERAYLCPTSSCSPIPLRGTSENYWWACLCLTLPRSSTPLGSTPTRDSFRHPIASITSCNLGKFLSLIMSGFAVWPRRLNTERPFYFLGSIEHFATQSRDWSEGSVMRFYS